MTSTSQQDNNAIAERNEEQEEDKAPKRLRRAFGGSNEQRLTMMTKKKAKRSQRGDTDTHISSSVLNNSADKSPKAVDLVTGKAKVEYFFDPALLLKDESSSFETPIKQKPSGAGTPYRKDLSSSFAIDSGSDPLLHRHLFIPCTIIKSLYDSKEVSTSTGPFPGPTLVKTSDGILHKISDSTKLIPLTSPDDYLGVEDVLHLPNVTEASLLHTLRLRYTRDDIYTSAGPILIAINPYKVVKTPGGETLYSDNRMLQYREPRDPMKKMPPPHLFQVADRAYTAMLDSVMFGENLEDDDSNGFMSDQSLGKLAVKHQSIVISGESGAGKTEATKIIMQYLARITKAKMDGSAEESHGNMVAALEDRVLSSNPLLETFGNARTLRNDNSSRFGKFIRIFFSTDKGCIVGASISNYLLEKTRITHQIMGERNYHIFYQILAGGGNDLIAEFGLEGGPSSFQYLGLRNEMNAIKDAAALEETKECLASIGLETMEQKIVFQIVAAILHLGNIEFQDKASEDDGNLNGNGDTAVLKESSRASLSKACSLLGLPEKKVEDAILTKLLSIGGKIIHKDQNVSQAEDKRDALAKMAYSCLFLWLVQKVNGTLDQTSEDHGVNGEAQIGFIGVLDIYGFEVFETNGFEQFLINYCNEKLQRHFNRHLFEVEQDLYASEGVDWTYITFNDNKPCLELIEGAPGAPGILNTLDDSWGGMGTASEKEVKFVGQLHKQFGSLAGGTSRKGKAEGGHQFFVTPKFGNDKQFIICHYAGEVRYTVTGFIEKNMETLSNELKDLGEESEIELARASFRCGTPADSAPGGQGRRSTIRGVSVGTQFRMSLQALVADLERTQPHYIRCIKPNLDKAPNALDSGEVLRQLRYSGMMEAIRIRREGYALREDHVSFYNRFSVLLNPEDVVDGPGGIERLVSVISKRLNVTEVDWQIGHSKIFLRKELAEKLERLARLRVHAAARTMTKFGRRVARRRAAALLVALVRFRLHMIKKYRRDKAVTKIAAVCRSSKQRKIFLATLDALIRLQSHQRRRLAVRRVDKIRDPYGDKSFHELNVLLESESRALDEAVAAKNFEVAAKTERKIQLLKDSIESKRPMTRSLLEEKIAELQEQLDSAIANREFDKCHPIQVQLEDYVAKRAELPTMEELETALETVEREVAIAVERRDFATAAEGQNRIALARKRLEDARKAEEMLNGIDASNHSLPSHGYRTRRDLEEAIRATEEKLQEALSKKNFKEAKEIQLELDAKEALRAELPTGKELRQSLMEAKEKLDNAIASKDYARASGLHEEIDILEKKLADEGEAEDPDDEQNEAIEVTLNNGTIKKIESRTQLEEEIEVASLAVSEAVSGKRFKEAENMQQLVDNLEGLRAKLPTADEIEQVLRENQKEMDLAISKKEFSRAEELDAKIEGLKQRLSLERSREPPKINPSVPITGVAPTPSIRVPSEIRTNVSKRPVSKLRPKRPVLVQESDSILVVCQTMSAKRVRAAIVPGNGTVAGIITDGDITRRVVAKELDPDRTVLQEVMTKKPICVTRSDSAADALTMMIENRYRHLPVVDKNGEVVGLLDIAKCLNDAITKLERKEEKNSAVAQDTLRQVVNLEGASGAQVAALQALLGPLMSGALQGQTGMPTLRSVLAGRPSTIVGPDASVLEAAKKMSESRKAALIVENSQLVGIMSFKDVMSRVIGKGRSFTETVVSAVMTPNPESVLPDSSVLEALQTMHDHNFLTLPVCESDGRVVGLVDVMDVIYGCGGAEGWRSIFDNALDADDDISEASDSMGSTRHTGSILGGGDQSVAETKAVKSVSKLRPKKPLVSTCDDNVLSVVQMLANKRGDASVVLTENGLLEGIITDKDITRRVVAKKLSASETSITMVMTPKPMSVRSTDSAMEAMTLMVENHFRHLPVVDDHGLVVGLLDIGRCLNDAISKLEKNESRAAATQETLKNVVQGNIAPASQSALQALLGTLVSQAVGSAAPPKLRGLLAGKPNTTVSPDTSLLETGILMAEKRKAALVVKEGKLVGIFGFKDMMNRAVAKELPLDVTPVSSVMTSNPESVSPDVSVLEALQTMHDHKFLTLPVCEENGEVVGIVDVMDLIYGCGGADGWRSIFSSALDLDDASEVQSVFSHGSASIDKSHKSATQKKVRNVSKLRPKKPIFSKEDDSVLAMARLLASKRSDASLIVNASGGLAGIVTDKDLTQKVISEGFEPATVTVGNIMRAGPPCVLTNESAMDALTKMVENHIRHLPVLDDTGAVTGLLDIAKCLNDAMTRLSKKAEHESSGDAMKQALRAQGVDQSKVETLHALLGPLLAQATGGESLPKLSSLLQSKPTTLVSPETSIRETSKLMAASGKAALVVEDGRLIGIFGFKDMMTRVVAKELPLDHTLVSSVMTSNPEYVSPDLTVLEGLETMHDNRFLTLPVCRVGGEVVGVLDVMDLIYGCGGAAGWRSVFEAAIDYDGDDSQSVNSKWTSGKSVVTNRTPKTGRSVSKRTVSKLRPKKPVRVETMDTVLAAAQHLASKRATAAIAFDENGMAGIMTDSDFTRRVAAKGLSPATTMVVSAMTPKPDSVRDTDPAMDALTQMIENRYRHLPVVDADGLITGVLDIARCLNDAISKLERQEEKKTTAAEDALRQVVGIEGASGAQVAALQALLGPLMAGALQGQTGAPTLRSVLEGRPSTIVDPSTSIQEAAMKMAECKKAALIVDNGELVGILSFKDVMNRVIAKELSFSNTKVEEVMTPNPESVLPDSSVIEALQTMHDSNFLTLPVCENDGRVVGIVDVMDVIYGCGGAEGWRSIFDNALDIDDEGSQFFPSASKAPQAQVSVPIVHSSFEPAFVSNVPRNIEIEQSGNQDNASMMDSFIHGGASRGFPGTTVASFDTSEATVFKVVEPSGKAHRIRSELKVTELYRVLLPKLGSGKESSSIHLQFIDDEGDAIAITSDECLIEATELARASGSQVVKLSVVDENQSKLVELLQENAVVLAGAVVAGVAIAMIVSLRPRR